jgi:hypothetical protein
MDRIKLSRDLQQQVGAIIACYALIYYGGHTKEAFVACVLQHGKSSVEQCVPIFERCNPELEEYCTQIQRWLLEMPVYTVAELAIRGADLVQVGVLPGPAIGEGLQHILQQVALGLVENDRISLLNYMKSKMEGTK